MGNNKSGRLIIAIAFLQLLLIAGCSHKKDTKADEGAVVESKNFSVKGFNALTNFENTKDSIRPISLEYFDAINTGFIIPSQKQTDGGYFTCRFQVKNTSGKAKNFQYKIYYQNESYKFPEADTSGTLNPFCVENFYGSWDDSTILFRKSPEIPADGEYHEVIDSIRIVGNPRNEEVYYANGMNDRWKRNPRVGTYSFLLVVTEEENISANKIPASIQNIGLRNFEDYLNPYYYFLYGDGKKAANTIATFSSASLKVIAHPDLGGGIYVNRKKFPGSDPAKYSTSNCGVDTNIYRTAPFMQYLHYIDASTRLENIPVVADVLKDNYSKRDYNWNRSFYRKEELVSGTPMITNSPCETAYSDPVNKKIVIHNPKTTAGKWKKENTGVITRNGFTYGKYRVKAKLTELLNKNNVWNGLTNAIWLTNCSEEGKWNLRRPCRKEGYMATYWGGHDDKRIERVSYSEIDFEILKTPAYCPEQTFPPVYQNPTNNPHDISSWNTPLPDEIMKDDGNITVACTNWDMACWEPANFGVGCQPISYQGKNFEAHRWDHWYRALTEKTPASDDSLFGGDYYYFEIEWKPTEIIWRIGPEPDKMYVVGYMNENVSSIPDNQMLLIVTQEFHNTQWWPGSAYQQKNIPFPKNDIFGEILDVTIE